MNGYAKDRLPGEPEANPTFREEWRFVPFRQEGFVDAVDGDSRSAKRKRLAKR